MTFAAAPAFTTGAGAPLPGVVSLTGSALSVLDAHFESLFHGGDALVRSGSYLTDAAALAGSRRASGSRTAWVVQAPVRYAEVGQPASEIVNSIRRAFGLSVTDLASVLGVERPTIYSWLKGQSTPSAARFERLELVLRLADNWTAASGGGIAPIMSARAAEGMDLLSALRAPALWENEILASLLSQAAALKSASRRTKLSSVVLPHEINERPTADFDLVTQRALAPEAR